MVIVLLDKNNRFVIAFDNKYYKVIYEILTKHRDKLKDVFSIKNVYIMKSENYTINKLKNILLNYDS